MDRLQPKLIKPESTLIEKTALELAASFYEIGRGQGLKSKYKNARSYAKAYVKNFIPKAVDLLMDILAKDSTPQAQKDAIYDCLLERVNDKDLASTGIPVFENPAAFSFIPDTKDNRGGPLVINNPNANSKKKKRNRIEDLPLDVMIYQGNKING
ncbi:MAG: hypothetical protein KGI58_03940 [Patescibacteria group bacterium]|nr:hypothetical protein [Patescibacteria group bacterium]